MNAKQACKYGLASVAQTLDRQPARISSAAAVAVAAAAGMDVRFLVIRPKQPIAGGPREILHKLKETVFESLPMLHLHSYSFQGRLYVCEQGVSGVASALVPQFHIIDNVQLNTLPPNRLVALEMRARQPVVESDHDLLEPLCIVYETTGADKEAAALAPAASGPAASAEAGVGAVPRGPATAGPTKAVRCSEGFVELALRTKTHSERQSMQFDGDYYEIPSGQVSIRVSVCRVNKVKLLPWIMVEICSYPDPMASQQEIQEIAAKTGGQIQALASDSCDVKLMKFSGLAVDEAAAGPSGRPEADRTATLLEHIYCRIMRSETL